LAGGLNQRVDIGGLDVEILGNLGRARIARGDKDFFDFRALSQLPDQRVLPGSATDDENFYLVHPPLLNMPAHSA
jgi:hypothetical protein